MSIDRLAHSTAIDHSPCVGHCTYDEAETCLSCRRFKHEVDGWRDGTAEMRQSAWKRIASGIDEAGVGVMRLPLAPDDIAGLAREVLSAGGAWAAGISGHWLYGHKLISDDNSVLSALGSDGRITLDLSGKMRALAWGRGGRKFAHGLNTLPIVIVVPRARLKDTPHYTPTQLDDGRLDLGYGLASVQLIRDGDALIMQTPLATTRETYKPELLPKRGGDAVPADLTLPESFVLGAVLLPSGESPLD